ncbi:MAG: hypothetical protein K9G37_05395 [Crocinitomicaceae bacterium]|nr:hypothetical protein [Crocinitomicaceae bacterium]
MEIKKVNLDRKPITSEYIQSKQDFQHVVNAFSKTKIPVWKQPLFYGAIGVASLATVVTSTVIHFNNTEIDGKTITLSTAKKEDTSESKATMQFASVESSPKNQETKSENSLMKSNAVKILSINTDSNELVRTISSVSLTSKKSIEDESFSTFLPNISGVYQGDIAYDKLCSSNGIEVKNGVEVRSFKIQYATGISDKEVVIKDKKLSEVVCKDLEKSGFNQMVFITEIEAFDGERKITLPSMNFWVKFDS